MFEALNLFNRKYLSNPINTVHTLNLPMDKLMQIHKIFIIISFKGFKSISIEKVKEKMFSIEVFDNKHFNHLKNLFFIVMKEIEIPRNLILEFLENIENSRKYMIHKKALYNELNIDINDISQVFYGNLVIHPFLQKIFQKFTIDRILLKIQNFLAFIFDKVFLTNNLDENSLKNLHANFNISPTQFFYFKQVILQTLRQIGQTHGFYVKIVEKIEEKRDFIIKNNPTEFQIKQTLWKKRIDNCLIEKFMSKTLKNKELIKFFSDEEKRKINLKKHSLKIIQFIVSGDNFSVIKILFIIKKKKIIISF